MQTDQHSLIHFFRRPRHNESASDFNRRSPVCERYNSLWWRMMTSSVVRYNLAQYAGEYYVSYRSPVSGHDDASSLWKGVHIHKVHSHKTSRYTIVREINTTKKKQCSGSTRRGLRWWLFFEALVKVFAWIWKATLIRMSVSSMTMGNFEK